MVASLGRMKRRTDYYELTGDREAVEDLTGGVTTELFTSDILDTDKFWNDELRKVNIEFLFGCATGRFDDWQGGGQLTDRKGIQPGHAYSIMKAQEIKGERLLLIRYCSRILAVKLSVIKLANRFQKPLG